MSVRVTIVLVLGMLCACASPDAGDGAGSADAEPGAATVAATGAATDAATAGSTDAAAGAATGAATGAADTASSAAAGVDAGTAAVALAGAGAGHVPWATDEALALAPLMPSTVARDFLAQAARLPPGKERQLYRHDDGRYFSERTLKDAPWDEAEALTAVVLDEDRFYTTKYGSPLAYVRVLQLLGEHGLDDLEGQRLLDFGYGTIGHLRMLALAGVDAVGVDVDPFLPALYSERDDTGRLGEGRVTLVDGRWPSAGAVLAGVGDGFDVFTSKNTLKRGYIHPAEEVDPRMTIQLGVDDATFLEHLHDVLKPGGLAILYNLCPPPNEPGERYIPWADGRSPFSEELWDAQGFDVLAFDVNDDEAARQMALALGWDAQMDPETQLFALYTVVRRRE